VRSTLRAIWLLVPEPFFLSLHFWELRISKSPAISSPRLQKSSASSSQTQVLWAIAESLALSILQKRLQKEVKVANRPLYCKSLVAVGSVAFDFLFLFQIMVSPDNLLQARKH
jgi:hypothetical protein